jgi:phage gp36-like protein
MSAYATIQAMIDLFGEREMRIIGDPDGTGALVEAHVQGALNTASEQIDFYAGQRCALPLVITSPAVATFLSQLCMDIARYRLTGSSGITATNEVHTRYQEAVATLDKITSGKIILCSQTGLTPGGSAGSGLQPDNLTAGEAESEGAPRRFGIGSLNDYMYRVNR